MNASRPVQRAFLPALLTAAALLIGCAPRPLTIVSGGEQRAVIVVPETPLPVERYAAEELQFHIEAATGAKLPIVPDADAEVASGTARLYVGRCRQTREAGLDADALPPNGFVLRRAGEAIHFLGDDTDGPVGVQEGTLHANYTRVGTLLAVYDFCERELGARWLWPGPGGLVIDRRDDLAAGTADRTHAPRVIHKRWRDNHGLRKDAPFWFDKAAAGEFAREQARWLRRHRFAMAQKMNVAHAFTRWWDRYGEDHPEYFALLPDGTRRPDPVACGGHPALVHMCVSEPALHERIVAEWLAKRKPGDHTLDVSENDGLGGCLCEHCLALDARDPNLPGGWEGRVERARAAWHAGEKDWVRHLGSLSDRYARFMLAVQRLAELHDPQVVVANHAYSNYVQPPRETELNERIVLAVVPGEHYPWRGRTQIQDARRIWQGWRDAGARLMLRPNYMLGGHNMPLVFARQVVEGYDHAWRNGLIGTDYDSLTGQFAARPLTHYVLARKHAHPELDYEQIAEEFFAAFGPAEEHVRDYCAAWEAVSSGLEEHPLKQSEDGRARSFGYFHRVVDELYGPELFARSRDRLDAAAAAAEASGDPQIVLRVQKLRRGLEEAALTRTVAAAYRAYKQGEPIDPYIDAMAKLVEFRREHEPTLYANVGFTGRMESYSWDRDLPALLAGHEYRRLAEGWRFAFDPENEGLQAGWKRPQFDDSSWAPIRTDRPWEQQPVGEAWAAGHDGRDFDGFAWYRLRFEIPADAVESPGTLVFGAVDEACTVWVNGKKLLHRPYPYRGDKGSWKMPFAVDLAGAVRPGENVLAVRVQDNSGVGGIFKPVFLIAAEVPPERPLANGGFEAPFRGAWSYSEMNGDFEYGRQPLGRSGIYAAWLECVGPIDAGENAKPHERAWARLVQPLFLVPGKPHRLRLAVRTAEDFTGRVRVWLFADKDRVNLDVEPTGGKWKLLELGPFTPETAEGRLLLNVVGSTGRVWFDDVEILSSDAALRSAGE